MGTIKWLQLSDLHFGSNSEYTENCRKQLLGYLKKWEHDIDYMFITGDIIYAKDLSDRKDAYDKAIKYIKDIAQIFWQNSDIDTLNDRVFVVPGNHDVIRNPARKAIVESILKEYQNDSDGKIDESFLKNCTESINDYNEFMQYIRKDKFLNEGYHYVISTEKMNIVHLNTCIASGKDNENSTLVVGYELLSQALKNIKDDIPTVVLAHHSLEYLEISEQKKVEILLKDKNIGLYLCGHSHKRESNIILRHNQNKLLNLFTAGTLMSSNNDLQDAVIFKGELNTESLEGKIYSYKWTYENKWHDDMDFGLVQGNKPKNFRQFRQEISMIHL